MWSRQAGGKGRLILEHADQNKLCQIVHRMVNTTDVSQSFSSLSGCAVVGMQSRSTMGRAGVLVGPSRGHLQPNWGCLGDTTGRGSSTTGQSPA